MISEKIENQNLKENITNFPKDKMELINEQGDIKEKERLFNEVINKIINDFINSKKSIDDYQSFFDSLKLCSKHYNNSELNVFWTQEQVREVVNIFDEGGDYLEENFPKYMDVFYDVMCDSVGSGEYSNGSKSDRQYLKDKDGLSEKVASVLVDDIFNEKKDFSNFYLNIAKSLHYLFENDPSAQNALDHCFFHAEEMIEKLRTTYEKNKTDVKTIKKILDILSNYLSADEQDHFEGTSVYSEQLLEYLHECDIYFSNKVIENLMDEGALNSLDLNTKRNILAGYFENIYSSSQIKKMNENQINCLFFNTLYDEQEIDFYPYSFFCINSLRREKYDEEDLHKNIKPLEDIEDEECIYSQLFEDYGVIYAGERGNIDSFFATNKNGAAENLNLKQVLINNGLDEEWIANNSILINNYSEMIKLSFREQIENEFKINFKNFKIRELLQFCNYISTKTTDEVEKVKKFLGQSQNQDERMHRIKSFLSLESGKLSGEQIINIGDSLKDEPEAAEKLFSKFVEITDNVDESVEEVVKMYEEIYFDTKVDTHKLKNLILNKAVGLLQNASLELQEDNADKKEIIDRLIKDLEEGEEKRSEELRQFKEVAKKMNEQYKRIEDSYISFLNQKEKEEIKKEMIEQGESTQDIHDYLRYIDWTQNCKYDGAIYDTLDAYEEMLEEEEKDKHFDSQRIRNIIKEMEGYVEEEPSEKVQGLIDNFKKYLKYQENFEEKFEKLVYGQESASLPENFQEKIIEEIENYQSELPDSDKKPYLPVGISSLLPEEGEVHAKPIDTFAYIMWLQNQGRKADFMVVDTIQESNYQSLYGLDREEAREKAQINGQRDEKWYSSIKKNFDLGNIEFADYSGLEQSPEFEEAMNLVEELDKGEDRSEIISEALDNLVEKSVKNKASQEEVANLKEYGKKEIAFIMARKDLKISHEKEYRYDIMAKIISVYKELKDRMEELKDSRREYLEQRGVPQKKIGKILKELESDRSLTELSLYLSYYENYPRTYHLAADIFGTEERARNLKNQKDKSSKDKSKELKIKATNLRGQMTSVASQYQEEEESVKPINKNINNLGLLKRGTEAKHVINKWRGFGESVKKEDWFRNLELPEFYYPKQVTGMSFEMQDEKSPGYTAFREFYSTYKGESEEELPIEANQVIASTSPLAASKLLVLDEKKQREYYDKVLKPLLVNYYIATSKDKEEAKKRFEQEGAQSKTISEIVRFVQNNIVKPVEGDMKSQN